MTIHVPTFCDWFGSSASASDSDNLVSLDHKWNVSDGVVSEIGTLFSLVHKLYASDDDSDSDSVAGENHWIGCIQQFVPGVTIAGVWVLAAMLSTAMLILRQYEKERPHHLYLWQSYCYLCFLLFHCC